MDMPGIRPAVNTSRLDSAPHSGLRARRGRKRRGSPAAIAGGADDRAEAGGREVAPQFLAARRLPPQSRFFSRERAAERSASRAGESRGEEPAAGAQGAKERAALAAMMASGRNICGKKARSKAEASASPRPARGGARSAPPALPRGSGVRRRRPDAAPARGRRREGSGSAGRARSRDRRAGADVEKRGARRLESAAPGPAESGTSGPPSRPRGPSARPGPRSRPRPRSASRRGSSGRAGPGA